LPNVRIEAWPLLVISSRADAPSSASCVSAEWRNWRSVARRFRERI